MSYERLRDARAEPQNWMHYWGDYHGHALFERSTRSRRPTCRRLQARWTIQLPGSSTLETQPLVVDGVMYTSGQPGTVAGAGRADGPADLAIHATAEGEESERDQSVQPRRRRARSARFVGTLDAALVALDARTGLPLWEAQVADTMLGYSITSAPLVVKDKVIVGVSGGEFGARGFLDAYDAATGQAVWRWYSVPAPGEFGNDTWAGDSWKHGAGPMWLTGSYDPELNTLYWTVGNPGAQIDRSVRGNGDNLFTDSVVALDPDTGRRQWHYQFTPNDGHDWDSAQDVVLVDRMWHGQNRKLLLHADRNAHFYVLDRTNGAFLSAWPFAYQNWNRGFDASGRPLPEPGSNSSPEGSFLVFPSVGGGTNFQAPSYSPKTGWFYLEYAENGRQYVSAPQTFEAGPRIHRRRERSTRSARRQRTAAVGWHQGARPRDGPNDVGLQALSGLVDQWRIGHSRRDPVRGIARRQLHRARRGNGQVSVALPDRRQYGGVADELRGGWHAVRRHRIRRGHLLLCASRIMFRQAVALVRNGEASVALRGDLDPVTARLVHVGDERLCRVVPGPGVDREVQLPEILKCWRVVDSLPRAGRAALFRAVVHDRDARPQSVHDEWRA